MAHNDLVDLLLSRRSINFGEFVTKAGRQTPYFINTSSLADGVGLKIIGELYAKVCRDNFSQVENVFGPSYKGIPLAVMTTISLSEYAGHPVSYTYNRKEVKTHGEGGNLVGYKYLGKEKVVITEDILTAGTSVGESCEMLKECGVNVLGVIVGIDRQEVSKDPSVSAKNYIEKRFDLEVKSICSATDILVAAARDEYYRPLVADYRQQLLNYFEKRADSASFSMLKQALNL